MKSLLLSSEELEALLPDGRDSVPPPLAQVDEDWCIGCVRCIKACPVDAIVGAPRQMHVVLKGECIGCEHCVSACPVDCIEMLPRGGSQVPVVDGARQRYRARKQRLRREQEARRARRGRVERDTSSVAARQAAVAAALDRVRGRRQSRLGLFPGDSDS